MSTSTSLQAEIERVGRQIFDLIDRKQAPANFLKENGFHRWLMDWSMENEAFKTQMFRFVDVLPTLTSSNEVVRHMAEYLKDTNAPVSGLLRGALTLGSVIPAIPAMIIRKNVLELANIFIAGTDGKSALPNLRRIWKEHARFTVDILGEAVVSNKEADEYAARYGSLLDFLAGAIRDWKVEGALKANEPPLVNVSIKISALCARIQAADPAASIAVIMTRLKPIVLRARELGAFINLDMEHYSLKELTLELFKALHSEAELSDYPHLGIVIQAYLRDSYTDAEEALRWARETSRQFTLRLVKGAYWDYEKVIAGQRTWTVPVYTSKPETDANYEKITRLLLEGRDVIYPAFASHNVRSIAHAIVWAQNHGLKPGDYEFQMLYGMATPVRRALVSLGHRVREYCPVGELVPGMAYLVRRLLENTSNEGFLRAKFTEHTSISKLLEDPADTISGLSLPGQWEGSCRAAGSDAGSAEPAFAEPRFVNDPPADFALARVRHEMSAAIEKVRNQLGQSYPLVIDGKPVIPARQMPSVNPASPHEIIGQIARAEVDHVVAAVDAARRAFPKWSRTTPGERARLLERAAGIMRRRRFELAAWQVFEVGKTWAEADADVVEAIDYCMFYAEEIRRLSRGRLTQDVPGEVSIESYVPRGVGVIIAPWNFPLAILCGMTVAALVVGNTVIIKPAEQSSVIGSLLMKILQEAGLPGGVANLLSGPGEEVGALLVVHPDIDFVGFTGSREVGTKIWETAAVIHPGQRNLKKVVCEMGGKNAAIIDSDADLDEAVLGVVQSAFAFQGQKCSALSRLITVRDAGDRLLPRLVEACAALKIGMPEDPSTDVGPVIDGIALRKIQSYTELGKKEHRMAFQGKIPSGLDGYFVGPTIFVDVDRHSRLAQEEIFGPVLVVIPADDLSDAIAIANDTPFALTGGLYSRSPQTIERVRREFLVGNLYINRAITGAVVGRHPFGGFKMSGSGTKAGGHDYLLHFTFPRVVTENTLRRGFAPDTENAPTAEAP
jgi:RHH-type proline utilization regulon transcriptional repressor/proline dehydrogenase/delta 1-pyrroline-5-carboxylate dehydrogenase